MSEAFESIEQGLKDAIAHARGEAAGIVHTVAVSEPDVAAIRARTGLSQAAFARSIGVAASALSKWERRHRAPDGPARVLLSLIDKDPGLVQRTLNRTG